MDWEIYGDKASAGEGDHRPGQEGRPADPRDRPRSRGRGDQLARARAAGASARRCRRTSQRVTFNAITKAAVTEAMLQPRELDQDLIDAYLARRALDYLFGFTLSPVLWRKLPGAKSAGRVQSVALRLIVEREREIEAFRVAGILVGRRDAGAGRHRVRARLVTFDGREARPPEHRRRGHRPCAPRRRSRPGLPRRGRRDQAAAGAIPPPPFTTSTLQQEAARKLGFSASHTMRVAQKLYEAGAITYMRTDGVQMDPSAITAARAAIADRYERALRSRKTASLRDQGQECAGSA